MLNLLHTFYQFENFIQRFNLSESILDKSFNTFLKTNKSIGSKDRKLLSEIVYYYFRNLYYIQFLSKSVRTKLIDDNSSLHNHFNHLNHLIIGFLVTVYKLNQSTKLFEEISKKYNQWNFSEQINKLLHKYNIEVSYSDEIISLIDKANIDFEQNSSIHTCEKLKNKYSFPDFLISSIAKNIEENFFEEVADSFSLNQTLSSLNQKALVFIRITSNKNSIVNEVKDELTSNEIFIKKTILPDCYSLNPDKVIKLTNLTTFQKGYFEIQDFSSQLTYFFTENFIVDFYKTSDAVDTVDTIKILDLCAGGGGKTLLWADKLNSLSSFLSSKTTLNYRVYSSDISENRLMGLKERLLKNKSIKRQVRTGLIHKNNPDFKSYINFFDLLIIDAPCSGLGTVKRDPNLKYRLSPENLNNFQNTQMKLIEENIVLVRSGGIILYITCSISYQENIELINIISKKYEQELTPIPIFDFTPFYIKNEILNVLKRSFIRMTEQNNFITILPQFFNSDGFFVSLFKKN